MSKNKLDNGADVLKRKDRGDSEEIVLCLFREEFVTWVYLKESGACLYGRYHGRDLDGAIEDFKKRD